MSIMDAKEARPVDDPKALVPFGWAPGGYYCASCASCGQSHSGSDKRSSRCQDCAEDLRDAPPADAPSNANTSGLEVVAWRTVGPSGEWEAFITEGSAEYRTKQCWGKPVEPLVTAASAQARIDHLLARIETARIARVEHNRQFEVMKDRATAAESRSDRLAKGMPDLSSVIGWLANGCDPTHAVTELRILQVRIDRALQQEG